MLFLFAAINLLFPPIPLETAAIFGGYLSATGHGSLLIIIVATVGGMFSSSLILYQVTKSYGMNLIEKSPIKKILTPAVYQKALEWFKKYGLYTLYLGKIVPGMTLSTIICCGILQLDAVKVLPALFLSNLIFFTGLVMAGRLLGANWGNALPWLAQIGLIALLFMAVFTVFTIIRYLSSPNKNDG